MSQRLVGVHPTEYDVPVTEQELVGLRLRRPTSRPQLRVRQLENGALLLRAGEADRWALEQLAAWRTA